MTPAGRAWRARSASTGEPVHLGHVPVGEDEVDVLPPLDERERLHAVRRLEALDDVQPGQARLEEVDLVDDAAADHRRIVDHVQAHGVVVEVAGVAGEERPRLVGLDEVGVDARVGASTTCSRSLVEVSMRTGSRLRDAWRGSGGRVRDRRGGISQSQTTPWRRASCPSMRESASRPSVASRNSTA
jgi:hypothetical protein